MKTKNLLNKKITQWLLLVAMLLGCSTNALAYYYIRCCNGDREMNGSNQYLMYANNSDCWFKMTDGLTWEYDKVWSDGNFNQGTANGYELYKGKGDSHWKPTSGNIYGWTFDNNHKLYISKIALQMYDLGKKNETKYVGDKVASSDYYVYYKICFSSFGGAKVYFFQSASSAKTVSAEWYEDDGNNRKYKANIKDCQFTSSGKWYVKGAVAAQNDNTKFAYTNNSSASDADGTTTLSANTNGAVYWEVKDLTSPTNTNAEAVSSSQINLFWTQNSTHKKVLVVRSTSSTAPTPVGGTAYTAGSTIGSGATQGTVVYYGTNQTYNNTGLTENTHYYYYFFSANNNYYASTPATADATTPKACAAPAQQTVSIGASKICSTSSTTISTTTSQSGYKYQLAKQNSENWDDVGDAVNGGSALSFTGINTAGTYKIYGYLSTDATCKSDMKNTVALSVDAAPVAGTVSGGTTICDGGSASLSRSSQSGTVDWEKSTTSATEGFSSLSSSASSYAAKSAGWYRVKVSNGVCTPVYATATQVNVDAKSSVGTITVTGSNPICEGSTTTLSVGTCVGDKKWQIYIDSDWSDAGSTDDTYTTSALNDNTQYRVYAKNGVCAAATTEATTITVNKTTVAGSITGAGDICNGGTKTLSSNGATATNYKWKSCSTESGTYVDASGTINLSTYSAKPTVSTYYKLAVKNGECSWAYTAPVRVVVNNKPANPGVITEGTPAPCINATGLTYSITEVATATGYTWTVPTGWSITAGAGTRSITATAGTAGGSIKVTANNDCGSSAEQTLAVTVKPAPNVSASTTNTTAYEVITLTNISGIVTWSKTDAAAYFVKDQQAVDGNTVDAESVNFKAPAKADGVYTITAKNNNNDCTSSIDITVGTATEVCN